MNAGEILVRAKELAGERSNAENEHGWTIFPLLRNKVIVDSFGWVCGILIGLGLFTAIAFGTIPYNFQHGVATAIVACALLGLMLFIGLGSAWALYNNIQRLRHAEQFMIVVTPDEFVQQAGDTIVQVPLEYVRHVTARGTRAPDRTAPQTSIVREIPGVGENVTGFFLGHHNTVSGVRQRRKRMRTPTTLAFIDARTDEEVIVITDSSHGDPFMIAAVLKQYASSAQHINT